MKNNIITGKNGIILGAALGTAAGLYLFRPDYGRVVGLAFFSTIIVGWGFAAYETDNKKSA